MSSNPPFNIPGLGYVNQDNSTRNSSGHQTDKNDKSNEGNVNVNGAVEASSSEARINSSQTSPKGHRPESSAVEQEVPSIPTSSGSSSLSQATTIGQNKTDTVEVPEGNQESSNEGPSENETTSHIPGIRPDPGSFGQGATPSNPPVLLAPSSRQNQTGAKPVFGVTAFTSAHGEPKLGFAKFATAKVGEDRFDRGGTPNASGNGTITGSAGGAPPTSSPSVLGPFTQPEGTSNQGSHTASSGSNANQGVNEGGGTLPARNTSSGSDSMLQSGERGNQLSASNVSAAQLSRTGPASSSMGGPNFRESSPTSSEHSVTTRMDLSIIDFPGKYKLGLINLDYINPEVCTFFFGVLAIQANLAPRFQFTRNDGNQWAAKLTFWGTTIDKQEFFDGKFVAKGAVCRQALEILKPQFESWYVPDVPTAPNFPGAESASTSWDWPHILEKYCYQAGNEKPVYTKYAVNVNVNGYRFKIDIAGNSYFGLSKFYPSEAAAKNAIAHNGLYSVLVHDTEDTTVFPGAPLIHAGFAKNWHEHEPEPPVPREHTENQDMAHGHDISAPISNTPSNSEIGGPGEQNVLEQTTDNVQPLAVSSSRPSGNQISEAHNANNVQRLSVPSSGSPGDQPSENQAANSASQSSGSGGNQISVAQATSNAQPLAAQASGSENDQRPTTPSANDAQTSHSGSGNQGPGTQATGNAQRPTAPPSGPRGNQPSRSQNANTAHGPEAPPSGPRGNRRPRGIRGPIRERVQQRSTHPYVPPTSNGGGNRRRNRYRGRGYGGTNADWAPAHNQNGRRWNASTDILRFQTQHCTSHRSRVAVICGILALQDPEYSLDLFNFGVGAAEYYAAAFFPTEPRLYHLGPVGRIRYTHGQRNLAIEECARQVALFLIEMVEWDVDSADIWSA